MVFKNLNIININIIFISLKGLLQIAMGLIGVTNIIVLWMKVALALEGLRHHLLSKILINMITYREVSEAIMTAG